MNLCTCTHDEGCHGFRDGKEFCNCCPCQAFTSSGEESNVKADSLNKSSEDVTPELKALRRRYGELDTTIHQFIDLGATPEPVASESDIEVNPLPKNTDNLRVEGVASESNQCVCGHDEADHKVMADRACWYEGVNGWGCGCPKFQPSHSEGDNPDSPSMPVDSIRKALKKSFTNLYVRQFTTDWQTQRLVRSAEIDVMDLAPLQALIKEAERNAVIGELERFQALWQGGLDEGDVTNTLENRLAELKEEAA